MQGFVGLSECERCHASFQCLSANCVMHVDGVRWGQCGRSVFSDAVNGPGCMCLRDADCRSGSCEWSSTGRYCAGSDKHSDKDTIE